MAAKLPDDPQHEFIQGPARQVADGAGRRAAFPADFVARIVKVLPPIPVLLPARLGSETATAEPAMNDALEEELMDVALQPVLGIAARPCLAAERVIGLLPELDADEGRMLSGVFLPPMPDDPLVEGIGDKSGDLVADEEFSTGGSTPAALAQHQPLGSAQPLRIQYRGYLGGTAQVTAEFKDAPGNHGFLRVDFNPLGDGIMGVTERSPSSVPQTALGALFQLVAHPLHSGFTLELSEGKQHVHHQHPHGRAGVEGLGGGHEMHVVLLQHLPQRVEVRQRAGDAVELVGDHHLDFPGPDGVQESLDARTFEILAGESGIIEEMGGLPAFMPVDGNGMLADVALGIQRVVFPACLVIGGNAGVDGATDERNGTVAVGGGGNGMEWFHGMIEGKTSG